MQINVFFSRESVLSKVFRILVFCTKSLGCIYFVSQVRFVSVKADPPPLLTGITLSRDGGQQGVLGLYADEAYL